MSEDNKVISLEDYKKVLAMKPIEVLCFWCNIPLSVASTCPNPNCGGYTCA